jgi:cell wall-associated NlpC family hydrolase
MTVTCCLLATVALPMSASADPDTTAAPDPGQAQTLMNWATTSPAAPVRDGYSVTMPAPVVVRPITTMATSRSVAINPPAQAYSGAAVLEYAAQFVGKVPYGMGNSPTTSFSCDGYTQFVFAGFGISLSRGADRQAARGVRIAKADAVAGDLVWWPGQHIGIYDGAGGMYNSPDWGRYVEHVKSLWGSPVFIRLSI